MKFCKRGVAPSLLASEGEQLSEQYAEKKRQNEAFVFSWKAKLRKTILTALKEMTQGHCSYCDSFPLDSTGREEIDHFRPKRDPRFYALVSQWENLFLSCTRCNSHKGDKWDEKLLRPDEADYSFSRYFEVNFANYQILPNLAATEEEKERARVTIEILNLNRDGLCMRRKFAHRCSEQYSDLSEHRYLFEVL